MNRIDSPCPVAVAAPALLAARAGVSVPEVLAAGQLAQSKRLQLVTGHVRSGFRLVDAGLVLVGSVLLTLGQTAESAAGPALLFDAASGRILYAEDQDDLWHPASLTKIMTLYLLFEQLDAGKLKLDTPLKVDGSAIYGIDVKLPNMVSAAIKARAVTGARRTIRQLRFEFIGSGRRKNHAADWLTRGPRRPRCGPSP